MSLIISAVPITLLDHMFPKCIDHIKKVIDKAPNDLSLVAIRDNLYTGKTMLVTISDGEEVVAINILETCTYSTGWKVLLIPITGGERMDEWLEQFMVVAHAIAKDYNCNELRGMACRKGWLRRLKEFGWYDIHMVIGCKVKQD